MVIFISGSINSGKTTTGRALAIKLDAKFIDIDDLNDRIPNFDLAKDISKGIAIAINETNQLTQQGKSVVLSYVIRDADRRQVLEGLDAKNPIFITLAPRLDVVLSDRGRGLSEWEIQRIKYHYDTNVAKPDFGEIIDNSDMSVDAVVMKIIELLKG